MVRQAASSPADGVLFYAQDQATRPRAFTFAGQTHDIADILSHWAFPDSQGYRVFTRDGNYFELIYRHSTAIWEVFPIVEDH